MPEAIARCDLGHRCRAWLCSTQVPSCKMHAACEQVLLGASAKPLVATNSQCSLRNPNCPADLRDVQRLAEVFLNQLVKSPHNPLVTPLCRAFLHGAPRGEAANHRLNECLLQSACRLGMSDNLRSRFCQVPGCRMQPPQLGHRLWLRRDYQRIMWWRQIASGDHHSDGSHILQRQRHRSNAGGSRGVQIGAPALSVLYDMRWLYIEAVPGQAWSRLSPERDDGATAWTVRMRNVRQAVGEPLHPQTMQINADDFRSEMSPLGDSQLKPCVADRRRIGVGIGEIANRA